MHSTECYMAWHCTAACMHMHNKIYGKLQDDFCCLHGIHGRSSSAYKSMHNANPTKEKKPTAAATNAKWRKRGKTRSKKKKTYLFDDITYDAFDIRIGCAPCRLRTRFSVTLFFKFCFTVFVSFPAICVLVFLMNRMCFMFVHVSVYVYRYVDEKSQVDSIRLNLTHHH